MASYFVEWFASFVLISGNLVAFTLYLMALPGLKKKDEHLAWGALFGGVLGMLGAIVWGVIDRNL